MLSNNLSKFPKLLGKMREQGKTQAYMSEKLGITTSTFSRIIKGKTEPFNIDQCFVLCNDLGVTLNDIFLS